MLIWVQYYFIVEPVSFTLANVNLGIMLFNVEPVSFTLANVNLGTMLF